MASTIGYNIQGNASFDRAVLLKHLEEVRPAMNIVMQDIALARQIKQLVPESTVVFRQWPDDNNHLRLTPQQWITQYERFAGNGIVLYDNNEPWADNLKALNDWTCSVMELARQRGIQLCVLNFSTGNPNHERVSELRMVLETAVRLDHYVGLHEYANTSIEQSNLWFLGRYKFITDYCKQIGITVPKILITEFGFDSHAPNPALNGWRSHGFSESIYAQHLRHAVERYYRPDGIPVAIFCWGDAGGWHNFDVANARTLHTELARSKGDFVLSTPTTVTFPSPTDPKWKVGWLQSKYDFTNIRLNPSTSSDIIGQVARSEPARMMPGVTVSASGYAWTPVMWRGISGWVSSSNVVFTEGNPAAQVDDVPFVSQNGTGPNNCGEAMLTMLMRHSGSRSTLSDVIAEVNNNGDFSSISDLIRAALEGFEAELVRSSASLSAVYDLLRSGTPVGVLVNRGELKPAFGNFNGAHFLVVTGVNLDFVRLNDPLGTLNGNGHNWTVPIGLFLKAWASSPGNGSLSNALLYVKSIVLPDEEEVPSSIPEILAEVSKMEASLAVIRSLIA